MRAILVAAFFSGISACFSEVLRISEVVDVEGKDTERMTCNGDGWEEDLLVRTVSIVTGDDVAKAYPVQQGGRWVVIVELDEKGEAKMEAATGKMKAGVERLAIIVDGQLISAPTVMFVPLRKRFSIDGGENMNGSVATNLGRKLSGLPPLPADEGAIPPKPQFEYEPYTEEEYQARKAARERMGLHHLECIPSDKELGRQLKEGMRYEDVVEVFGKPSMGPMKLDEKRYSLNYDLAPEKIPDNPNREMIPTSIKIDFTDGKVSGWSRSFSNQSRELKVMGKAPGALKMIVPEMNFSGGMPNIIEYAEGIVVPDGNQKVNQTDLAQLASLGFTLRDAVAPDQNKKPTLSADCDLVREISRHFPEVANLRQQAKKGRINLEEFSEALEPYALGSKKLPSKEDKGK